MASLLSQIQATSSTSGSGLDITSIVNGIISLESSKLNKLAATKKTNNDTVELSNSTMGQIKSVKNLFGKVVSAATNTKSDAETVSAAVEAFVNEFNTVMKTSKTGSREVKDAVSSLKVSLTEVKSTGDDSFRLMVQLGISTNRDGSVGFDPAKFKSEYTNNKPAVNNLLTEVYSGISSAAQSLTGYSSPLQLRNNSLLAANAGIDNKILQEQDKLDKRAQVLYAQYSKMDSAVAALNALGQNLTKIG